MPPGSCGKEFPGSIHGASESVGLIAELKAEDVGVEDAQGPPLHRESSEAGCTAAPHVMCGGKELTSPVFISCAPTGELCSLGQIA